MAATSAAPTDMLDPSAAGGDSEDPSQDQDTGGFTIEIEVDGQGNITVSLESAAQESSEGQGGTDDAEGTPAKNIADALKIAKEMYLAESGEAGGDQQGMWNEEAAKRGSPTATGGM